MITFLLLFSLIAILMEAEAYVNYGTLIVTKEMLIAPLIFAFYGQAIVVIIRYLKDGDKDKNKGGEK